MLVLFLCLYSFNAVTFIFYQHDLFCCSAQTVGVIVRLERENFHVLSMQGKVVEAKPQALHKRKEARFAAALDSEHNTIHRKDIVKVIDGPHSVGIRFSFVQCTLYVFPMTYLVPN